MHVLIPAGGRGSRLRPLTNDHPKPLLPLGDRPILSRILDRIPDGFPVTVLVTQELLPLFQGWRSIYHPFRDVRLYAERPRPSGLLGPVVALADCVADNGLNEDLLVMMGDSVHPFDWDEFLDSEQPETPRVAAYELPSLEEASRFGVLEFGADRKLTYFVEKPAQPRSRWIFTGCAYLPQGQIPALRDAAEGGATQMGHLVSTLLERQVPVAVHPVTGEWHDIGTFNSYVEAHRSHMGSRALLDLAARGNQVSGTVYVHPSAQVVNCRLQNCVIFAHTQVSNASLSDCVVQAHTSIQDRVLQRRVISREAELLVP